MTLKKQLTGIADPTWLDMSDYVVHFTKASKKATAYDNSMSILAARRIKAKNGLGIGRKHEHAKKSVCFSEVPPGQLVRLAKVRGKFGIGFRKDFVVSKGGGPILYAYKDTTHAAALRVMLEAAKQAGADDPFWHFAPFVDMPGEYPTGKYFFEWEREWRHVDSFVFNPPDAAFLIIPEDSHKLARVFFDNAEREQIGPNYNCPFIDATWSAQQIAKVLDKTFK